MIGGGGKWKIKNRNWWGWCWCLSGGARDWTGQSQATGLDLWTQRPQNNPVLQSFCVWSINPPNPTVCGVCCSAFLCVCVRVSSLSSTASSSVSWPLTSLLSMWFTGGRKPIIGAKRRTGNSHRHKYTPMAQCYTQYCVVVHSTCLVLFLSWILRYKTMVGMKSL